MPLQGPDPLQRWLRLARREVWPRPLESTAHRSRCREGSGPPLSRFASTLGDHLREAACPLSSGPDNPRARAKSYAIPLVVPGRLHSSDPCPPTHLPADTHTQGHPSEARSPLGSSAARITAAPAGTCNSPDRVGKGKGGGAEVLRSAGSGASPAFYGHVDAPVSWPHSVHARHARKAGGIR